MIPIVAAIIIMLSIFACLARLLTITGAFAAACIGLVTLTLGGFSAVSLLFLFFVSSNLLGLWRKSRKKKLGFEKDGRRDHWQVLANGGPAIIGLIVTAAGEIHLNFGYIPLYLFAAGLAEASADTWATEIGSAINSKPRSIVTWQPLAPGQSGGVTIVGTLAALAGSMTIAFVCVQVGHPYHLTPIGLAIALAGLVGALVDSILGATVQAQYRNEKGAISEVPALSQDLVRGLPWVKNDLVNFVSGLMSLAVFLVLSRCF